MGKNPTSEHLDPIKAKYTEATPKIQILITNP